MKNNDTELDHFKQRNAKWLHDTREYAKEYIRKHGRVSINDIRDACPVPEGTDSRICGFVFRSKDFKKVDYVPSEVAVEQHVGEARSLVGVYELK